MANKDRISATDTTTGCGLDITRDKTSASDSKHVDLSSHNARYRNNTETVGRSGKTAEICGLTIVLRGEPNEFYWVSGHEFINLGTEGPWADIVASQPPPPTGDGDHPTPRK